MALDRHWVCEEYPRLTMKDIRLRGLIDGFGIIHAKSRTLAPLRIIAAGWGSHIKLEYSLQGKHFCELVAFFRTPCNFGGFRTWFLCPICDRKCAVLFTANGCACRKCFDLRFISQYETPFNRVVARLREVRTFLGGCEDIYEPAPPRPHYMHYKTYEAMSMYYDYLQHLFMQEHCRPTAWGKLNGEFKVPKIVLETLEGEL